MELGTIVFYRDNKLFQDTLTRMNFTEKSLRMTDKNFHDYYNHDKQEVFNALYQIGEIWGFVCSIIKRRDGGTAYKILNSHDNVNTIPENEVYFALSMDDFTFTHWAEMENEEKVLKSWHGTTIIKCPSPSTIKKSNKIKRLFGLGGKMLYQIVSLENGAPSYPDSNPFNARWADANYNSYNPPHDKYELYYSTSGSSTHQSNYPTSGSSTNELNYPSPYKSMNSYMKDKITIHAVPFFRDNIVPTTFSTKNYATDLRMFINFPNGLPVRF